MFLVLFNGALVALLVYVIWAQIAFPLYKGNKIFPAFRKKAVTPVKPLKKELESTKEAVADLKEATVDLAELQVLKKEKAKLETQIEKLNK